MSSCLWQQWLTHNTQLHSHDVTELLLRTTLNFTEGKVSLILTCSDINRASEGKQLHPCRDAHDRVQIWRMQPLTFSYVSNVSIHCNWLIFDVIKFVLTPTKRRSVIGSLCWDSEFNLFINHLWTISRGQRWIQWHEEISGLNRFFKNISELLFLIKYTLKTM